MWAPFLGFGVVLMGGKQEKVGYVQSGGGQGYRLVDGEGGVNIRMLAGVESGRFDMHIWSEDSVHKDKKKVPEKGFMFDDGKCGTEPCHDPGCKREHGLGQQAEVPAIDTFKMQVNSSMDYETDYGDYSEIWP